MKKLISHIYHFEISEQSFIIKCCTRDFYLRILHIIYIRWHGFRISERKLPYSNKAWFIVGLFGLHLTFRVGIQHKTWFYIRNEELYSLRCKLYNWWNWPPF
jgi:hypothetical protein